MSYIDSDSIGLCSVQNHNRIPSDYFKGVIWFDPDRSGFIDTDTEQFLILENETDQPVISFAAKKMLINDDIC
jgi:hypothetical protein